MQHDVYGSSQTRETVSPGGAGTTTGERQLTDYVSDIADTVSSGTEQVVGFVSERPLLVGSVVVAALGAFVGARVAQMIAMRRRKTAYARALETLGIVTAMIGSVVSRRPTGGAMDRLAHSGKNIADSAQALRGSIREGLPIVGKPKMEQPSTIKQIGYGLSLIPVTVALVRNPLVRDIGFRFLARRIRRR